MGLRTVIPTLAILAIAAPLAAQQTFEGSITYQVAARGTNSTMTTSIKGTHYRSDVSMQQGAMSILSEAGSSVLTMVMNTQRMFLKIDPNNMNPMISGMMRGMGQSQPQPNITTFKATGQSETVAGKSCDHYLATDGATQIDICAAKGMGYFSMVPTAGMSPPPSSAQVEAYRTMFGEGFVPLKVTTTSGGTTVSITATALDLKPLDDAFFLPPAGYMEFKIP